MTESMAVQMAQRGVIVIPKTLRERYHLQAGDTLTLIDLDGVFVLSPKASRVGELADRLTRALADEGETLESMLHALREEREAYGRQA